MFGLEIGFIIKAVLALLAVTGVFLGIRKYGKLIGRKERQKAIQEVTKVNDENYKELADDVLDGGAPWGVQHPGATEITGPGAEPEVRVAPDVHRNGGADKSDGDATTTS